MLTIPWPWSVRRLLADQVFRFRETLTHLADGLRRRVTTALGEAVRALLDVVLEPPRRPVERPPWHDSYDSRKEPWQWDEDEADEPLPYASDRGEPWVDDVPEGPLPSPASSLPRWRLALAAGLEGVVLWLRRQRGWLPWLAATTCGLATLVGAPALAGLALLTSLIASLITQADQASTSAADLGRALHR